MKRLHLLIADPSLIVRRGIASVMVEFDSLGVDVAELSDLTLLASEVERIEPDVVVINPLYLGLTPPQELLPKGCRVLLVALQSHLSPTTQLTGYDATIQLSDEAEAIEKMLEKLTLLEEADGADTLSLRERDVVRAIALGRSNKEIADELFISTHTVATHRKNIANKLKIHNSAGLTIYAIVNKIIEIGDVT